MKSNPSDGDHQLILGKNLRNYAKQIRQAGKTAKTAEAAASSAVKCVKEATQETAAFVGRHWKGMLLVVGIGAIVALLFGGISSCSVLGGSGVGGVFTSSYLSEDADMLAAEAAYCAMEAELQAELGNYESRHPGYDEYRFDLDEIEHDPYVLISILTAFHEGIFTIDEVQADLAMLFEKQYILTETMETETRYRAETKTGTREATDPETGETTTEEYEYEVEVPYTYYICNVKLENFNLSHVPVYIMGEETLSMYATYMSTLGNREDLFPGSSYVGKYTDPLMIYEIPPSALEDETFAALITEAENTSTIPMCGAAATRTPLLTVLALCLGCWPTAAYAIRGGWEPRGYTTFPPRYPLPTRNPATSFSLCCPRQCSHKGIDNKSKIYKG